MVDAFLVFLNDGFDGLIRDVEKFNQPLSTPVVFLLLHIHHHSVASPHIISIKWLSRVNIVFLRSSGCQTEINYGKFFVFGMGIFDCFDGLAVFVDVLVHIPRVGEYLLDFTRSLELFLPLRPLDGVLLLLLLKLLV